MQTHILLTLTRTAIYMVTPINDLNLNFCIINQVAEEMQKIYTDTDIAEAQSNYDASKTAMDTSNTTYYHLKEHFEYSRRQMEEARVTFEKGLKVSPKMCC